MFGFVSAELSPDFDLNRLLNHGYLPRIYLSKDPRRLLNAYVANYLIEEIAAEGFFRFSEYGGIVRHRARQFFNDCTGLRNFQSDNQGVFSNSGRHLARQMVAQFSETPEKTGGGVCKILFFRCWCGEFFGKTRRYGTGVGVIWQGF